MKFEMQPNVSFTECFETISLNLHNDLFVLY